MDHLENSRDSAARRGRIGHGKGKLHMNGEPIRIAQVIGKLSAGGVESVIYNYYRHIDHSKFQFDFYIDADSSCQPNQELINMGARYYTIPPYQRLPQYILALTRLFRENRYQIVHSNMNTLAVFSLFAAWLARVPVRICHNHSTAGKGETAKNIMKYVLRPFAKIFATDYCACSEYAGEWLFGKRAMSRGAVTVFKNAIELERFRYDSAVRSAVRKELGLDNKFVVGHVGRFCVQKNHAFLLDVFVQIRRQNRNAVLLLVGDGELLDAAKSKTARLRLEDAVYFLGVRDDVNRLYQAMDVFVLPSLYEGLPVVGVEAQAAGLPCIVSDCVTKEAQVTKNICFLSLKTRPERWANKIISCDGPDRQDMSKKILDHGFDINSEGRKLQDFYTRKQF